MGDQAGTESETERLASLLSEWREPGALVRVRPILVVPDATNREHTQLSVEHIHYIASKMEKGFQSRKPNSTEGHDIPVLVRGHPDDPMAVSALRNWEKRSADHAGFPKPDPGLFSSGLWFTSLGNSHFFGALNLFRTNWPSIFTGRRYAVSPADPALREAMEEGVESIVLRSETPRATRKEISLLLNKCHDAKWAVSETGEIVLFADSKEYDQFEALSKVCDADELGALLRIKLGINEAEADGGYRETLVAANAEPPAEGQPGGGAQEAASGGGEQRQLGRASASAAAGGSGRGGAVLREGRWAEREPSCSAGGGGGGAGGSAHERQQQSSSWGGGGGLAAPTAEHLGPPLPLAVVLGAGAAAAAMPRSRL